MNDPQKPDYKSTLNLPKTAFPMKADLPKREPVFLKKWDDEGLYERMIQRNTHKPRFILHDGPPYANGTIHFGHILNKVLKDIIIKYKNLNGFCAEYIPGWDCHGLPIELGVDKRLGDKKKNLSPAEIRRECRKYAEEFIDLQRADFKRLGIFGRWDDPYLTMAPHYEADITREIGKIHQNGFLQKGYKPVHWCASCATALAEAEVEYENKQSPSIYVLFKASTPLPDIETQGRPLYFVIWTTTPWTLPANVAIAVGEKYEYAVVDWNGKALVLAKELVAGLAAKLNTSLPILATLTGETLLNAKSLDTDHPFLPRKSVIVAGHHVTLETGTGLVHIAPGHGVDDYKIGLCNKLPTIMPVDARGRFTGEVGVPDWTGLPVFQANDKIVARLEENDRLLFHENVNHSYPHCWRCKKPVIFRATEQWFILLDTENHSPFEKGGQGGFLNSGSIRQLALREIDRTGWIPDWGRSRIHNMVAERPDWCVSRQRLWGVPIPAFYCENSHTVFTPEITEHLAKLFEEKTSDLWFEKEAAELLPKGMRCPECPSTTFRKDANILDVWFDSGVSHMAVLTREPSLALPADLYLEGSDQHRGWFHSSLLTSVATTGKAPYKAVLTHGFVVDENGRKYSKSAKNYVPPEKILNEMGAELLRLWVSAEDYTNDIRLSKDLFTQLGESYRKIRNTCRFMLGSLEDFDLTADFVSLQNRLDIDRYAASRLQGLIQAVTNAYDHYEFHRVYHLLTNYCVVELSAIYLDILKDRLYTFKKTGPAHKSARSTLYEIVRTLALLMAPVLAFTAEDIWQAMPALEKESKSVFLADFPEPIDAYVNSELEKNWEKILQLRDAALKALEGARQAKLINHSLEAKVILPANEIQSLPEISWESILIVSQVGWRGNAGEPILVHKADGEKCPRCWNYATTIGQSKEHPALCHRCVEAVG